MVGILPIVVIVDVVECVNWGRVLMEMETHFKGVMEVITAGGVRLAPLESSAAELLIRCSANRAGQASTAALVPLPAPPAGRRHTPSSAPHPATQPAPAGSAVQTKPGMVSRPMGRAVVNAQLARTAQTAVVSVRHAPRIPTPVGAQQPQLHARARRTSTAAVAKFLARRAP